MIALGVTKLLDNDAVELRRVDKRNVHPRYAQLPFDLPFFFFPANDIMILRISEPSNATPATLNTDTTIPKPGDNIKAIGFGCTRYDGDLSPLLLKMQAPVLDDADCENPKITICTSMIDAAACEGDSGSPIFNPNTNEMFGIVSFGLEFDVGFTGYTRVSAFHNWIIETSCKISRTSPKFCPAVPTTPSLWDSILLFVSKLFAGIKAIYI